jgi:hypothetical protein
MAAAELTVASSRRPLGPERRAWLAAYGAVWAATLASAAIVAVAELRPSVRHWLRLRLQARETPPPSLGHVLALTAHNLPVAAWPLLLGAVGAHRHRLGRRTADALLVGCVAVNLVPVGAALGAYGPRLLPYLPQLPFEWAALAAGAASWITHREDPLRVRDGVLRLALIAGALLAAAVLETTAVPHR